MRHHILGPVEFVGKAGTSLGEFRGSDAEGAMRYLAMLALTAAMLAASAIPARAGPDCAAYFAGMGRTFVPQAPVPPAAFDTRYGVFDCPADQMMQFAYDYLAAKEALPVRAADDLVGTWVSDEFLGVVAGVFIPVFEVLEISPGQEEGEVRIVQQVLRYSDPAETWFGENGMMPPVDVAAAGRFAVYGDHTAALAEPGRLEPRRIRYFDFPIEGDRYTGLAMRMQMGSFQQTRPITVRTNGDRLVFELFDRMSPDGERLMTYRRRDPRFPRAAMLMIIAGEISASHFHCLMQAMEGPRPAFEAALGDVSLDRFLAGLEDAMAIGTEMESLRKAMSPDMSEADRKARGNEFLELAERNRALFEEGPLAPLRKIAEDPGTIGCRSL